MLLKLSLLILFQDGFKFRPTLEFSVGDELVRCEHLETPHALLFLQVQRTRLEALHQQPVGANVYSKH